MTRVTCNGDQQQKCICFRQNIWLHLMALNNISVINPVRVTDVLLKYRLSDKTFLNTIEDTGVSIFNQMSESSFSTIESLNSISEPTKL